MASSCQKEKNNRIKNIKRKAYQNLSKKYQQLSQKYNSNIIDNIIYNERSHIVALFKDRLIQDDNGEFLKRYYQLNEAIIRLPKFFEYYNLYSKIFPNYTSLEEGKYFYQNIQKKQKMIDIQEKNNIEKLEKENSKIFVNENIIINNNNQNKDIKEKDYVFSTDVINSILNGTNMEFIDLLFNINKENIKEEELIFSEKINNIIQIISKLENDRCKNKNFNQNKKSESNSKRKKDKKSNSGNKSKINNTFLGNDLNNNKNVKVNYFIKAKIRKSNIFNINDKKMNNSINLKNINNKLNKNEKNFIKKIEYNLFKNKKLISENHTKNILHNISISIKKDLSKSKKNSSNNSKKPSSSASSFNILNNNSSYNNKIKVYNKINPKNKKVKNSIKSPNPLTSRIINNAGRPNFFLDKSWININKMNQTKYNNSTNNIFQIKKNKKSLSNEKNSKKYKKNIFNKINNFRKNNINNINIHKKINNKIKERNKRKVIKYNYNTKKINNKINTYYLIDSRNYVLNEFLNSFKRRKTNSTKKKSANSKSNSRYNASKSRSKSNKNNKNNKNSLFDNNNILFKQNNKIKNLNSKNKKHLNNKYNNINWKIDSRNKRALFISKNTSKFKTKNILQNSSFLKASFLGPINYIKNSIKLNDIKNYSKLFKYIGNKNYCSKIQRNYSFNNIFSF